ncbi:hypothetical protein chiPu_0009794, partial [Chiloscyllium punctatum]|nr:hypothetical protein [Chiloscyllium punctatum]
DTGWESGLTERGRGMEQAQHLKDSMVAATGAPVRFPGTDEEFSSLHWEFSTSSKTLPIVDYNEGHQHTFDPYEGRVELNKSDGSLLLKDVREADTGNYRRIVNSRRTRMVTLTVIDPLSTSTISSNCSLEHLPVTLNRVVHGGLGCNSKAHFGLIAAIVVCLAVVPLVIIWSRCGELKFREKLQSLSEAV